MKFFRRLDRWLCYRLPLPLRIWWHHLWMRQDEFHPSYEIDSDYLIALGPKDSNVYILKVRERRQQAHARDF